MAAQIQIQDTIIELGEEINYNFQVGDIAEISKSKSTYTSSFKIPRLSEFERIFNGLAIPGDRSQYPYQINDVYLLDDYVPIMKGVLVFMRTDELYFNVTAISGAFDFFTEIGDTKFSDIDISEIVHEKTLDVVADRIEGLILQPYGGHYTYGFAQFGGMSHYTDVGGPVTVNIDALCPVVTARYLWDKIFESFPRFSFSGDFYSSQDFERLWVVMPYPPFIESGESVEKATVDKSSFLAFMNVPIDPDATFIGAEDFLTETTSGGYDWLECVNAGLCRITVKRLYRQGDTETFLQFVKNTPLNIVESVAAIDVDEEDDWYVVDIWLDSGDLLGFSFERESLVSATIGWVELKIDRLSATATVGAFDLKIRDFIKEVMWRYGLLAFVDNNHIDFVRMGDIIESNQVVDWSDKYVRRTEEEYTLDYNQNNWLRHKYDDEDADYFDRNIEVDNKNIPPDKTIIQSLFYAPSENTSQYRVYPERTIQVRDFLVFDPSFRDVDLEDDNSEFEYKTQQRYFFARVTSENLPYRIGSASMGGVVDSPLTPGITKLVHVVTFAGLPFADNPYYDALTKILNPTRAHRIELKLTAIDVNQLSLKRLYYFEQEQARYMLNKLQYKRGTVAKGEFIKISEEITGSWIPIDPYCVEVDGVNTGDQAYERLYDAITGYIKPNVPSDPDYVAPSPDADCPEEVTFPLFRTASKSNHYPFQVSSGGQEIKIIVRHTDGTISVQKSTSASKVIDLSSGPIGISQINTAGPIGYNENITLLGLMSGVVDLIYITNYPNLNTLDLTSNPIFIIPDLSGHPIKWLSLSGTLISSFDTGQVPGVVELFLDNTSISSINTANIPDVASLNVSSTNITALDISNNNSLTSLRCAGLSFTADGANTAIIDAIIIKMDQNINSGGRLEYGVNNSTGIQPSSAALGAYNSLLSKGCIIVGRQPV